MVDHRQPFSGEDGVGTRRQPEPTEARDALAPIGCLGRDRDDREVEVRIGEEEGRRVERKYARLESTSDRVELMTEIDPALRRVVLGWENVMIGEQ